MASLSTTTSRRWLECGSSTSGTTTSMTAMNMCAAHGSFSTTGRMASLSTTTRCSMPTMLVEAELSTSSSWIGTRVQKEDREQGPSMPEEQQRKESQRVSKSL